MLTRADLDEAVRIGIVTEQQASELELLPGKRRASRHAHALRDERFVFMKNFNEFFIALGVCLLGAGLWASYTAFGVPGPAVRVAFPFIVIAVMWALAEYLLPAGYLMDSDLDRNESPLIPSLLAVAVAWLFYLRFRLPFALLLVAATTVAACFAIYTELVGEPTKLASYALFLVAGIIALAAALWYDMSDRERLTRRADCAFWLTLIAAPLIVHPIVSLISPDRFRTIPTSLAMTIPTSVMTIAVVALFALVALVIDRRAFLVSSLTYLGGAMVYTVTQLSGEENALWITLLLMGAGVILLGIGWQSARRTVMKFVPVSLARHLPIIRA